MKKKFLKGKVITLALIASMLTCSASTYADETAGTFSEEAVIYYADSEDASYAWNLTKDDNGKDVWVKVLISELPEGANVEYDHGYVWVEGVRYEKNTVSGDSINQTEDLSEVVETPETPTEEEIPNNSEDEVISNLPEQSECSDATDLMVSTYDVPMYDLPEVEESGTDTLLEPEYQITNKNCPATDTRWEYMHTHTDTAQYRTGKFYFRQDLARGKCFEELNKMRAKYGKAPLKLLYGVHEEHTMYINAYHTFGTPHGKMNGTEKCHAGEDMTGSSGIEEEGMIAAIKNFENSPNHKADLLREDVQYCSISAIEMGQGNMRYLDHPYWMVTIELWY